MADIISDLLAQRRLSTLLVAGVQRHCAAVGGGGIYGVVSYGVTQRIRELGSELPWGATRRNVSGLVEWQGVSMAVLGSIVGLGLAIAATRITANVVYGVAPTDVTSFLGATTLLLLVAALASYIPSRRAAAIAPAVILRAE